MQSTSGFRRISMEMFKKRTQVNRNYPGKLLQALDNLRKQNQLCDIIINIGGRAFHAHKAVLAAASSYFLALFTSGFKESTESEVKIDGKAEVFEMLLQFAYTGELKITSKTAYDVLEMACYMQFTDVYPPCCDLIKSKYSNISDTIPIGDVFRISQLARNHDCLKQLVEESDKYMERNVKGLKRTDVFVQTASVAFLKEFLCRENLSSTKQVLEMVVSWLKYDWENRRTHSLCLLQKVRLGLVPSENLKQLIDAEILEIPECQVLLDHVLQLKSSTKSVPKLSQKHPELFSTRSTITAPISLYLDKENRYGYGHESMRKYRLQYFNTQDRQWRYLAKSPKLSSSSSLMVVEGKLYAAGGLERFKESDIDSSDSDSERDSDRGYYNLCLTQFLCYNSAKNKWYEMLDMRKARQKFSLVYLEGFIYAIAGLTDTEFPMSDVECYDMVKDKWLVLPSLPKGYRWVSAVVFRGKILVYGVSSRSHNHMLQVFHPSTGTWQMALSIQHDDVTNQEVKSNIEPALVIHKDVCYRVSYHTPLDSTGQPLRWSKLTQPSVHILEFESQGDDEVTVAVGAEVNQDYIPGNRLYTFRINDEVFVNDKGFVYKTDVEIGPDQNADVNLYEWENFKDSKEHSNVTWFTFDRNILER